jgi:hypothetical protein
MASANQSFRQINQANNKYNPLITEYIELKTKILPNKSKPIRIPNSNQAKKELSDKIIDLATKIYEHANSLNLSIFENISKFNRLKEILYDLYDIYTVIFIESQLKPGQKLATVQTYCNLKTKHKYLNNKYKKLGTNMSNFQTP